MADYAEQVQKKRGRRIVAWIASGLVGLVLIAAAGIAVWSQVGVYAAEDAPVASVRENPDIAVSETDSGIVLAPADEASDVGLVFIPGAKVEAWAYAARLQELAASEGITVVITEPWLNLAFFDPRPLSSFTAAAPDVDTWIVGGHSLGGVRACQLAPDADALALFASYCANDLSESGLPVLSIAGSEDGLSTPEKVADARDSLPADADLIEIDGANHASFADYGAQTGDGTASIDDAAMTAEVTTLVGALADTLR